MDNAKIEAIYSLSPVQQGMLFHSLQAPASGVYIEQLNCTIEGELDASALEQVWQQVIERHPILRTSFVWEQIEKPVQVVQRGVQLSVEQQDWRQHSAEEQAAQLEQLLVADRRQGFELVRAPLMRLRLLRLAEQVYQFIWSYHHLLLDGWSTALVLKEVFDRYDAIQRNQSIQLPPSRPYRDYINWLQRQDPASAETFWREMLQGVTAPTPLVVDRATPAAETSVLASTYQQLALSAEVTTRLQAFARQHQLTLNTLVQGVWAMLLHRYSGEEDIVFGVTMSGRPPVLPGAESMIGMFINTLPMRAQIPPDAQLLPWLKAFQDRQVELRQYEWSPLPQVQSWSQMPRGVPLFESILVFENYPIDDALRQWQGNLEFRNVQINERTNYPLTVIVLPQRELTLRILYDRGRFDDQMISRMLEHLRALLYGVIAQPTHRLSTLSLMSRPEAQQQLVGWNQTATHYDEVAILHQLVEAQVARTPDATAVVYEDTQLSYAELNARANQLAHYLRALGVGPEVMVGICVERSLELVVGLLGILKAGGAYVPLDPSYPAERLQFMLQDAGVPVLLTQAHLRKMLDETLHELDERRTAQKLLCLDADWPTIAEQPMTNPDLCSLPDQIAYMIYTSGSTGRPKGAMNTHAAICNRLLWMQAEYQLTATDRVLQKTPFSFDVSVWEFFWPLLTGAGLVLARPEGHKDSAYLVELIQQQQITTLHFVPSMLQAFVAEAGVERCTSLKRVICSGEALPYDLQQRFFARLDAALHNLYGPTEAAVDVSYWACQRDSSQPIVPIGRPVANTQLYVLDAQLHPVPVGVSGELYIGGVQLARGYLNRPALTAEKFIPNPFLKNLDAALESQSSRLYRTGDIVRYLLDGSIEYLGRADQQVKLRGFRIELGEIETALRHLSAVRDAAVLLRSDDSGAQRLVAYVVPERRDHDVEDSPQSAEQARPAEMFNLASLRATLKARLPEYMVPAVFVTLDDLPLTPNGKLDRNALPASDAVWREGQASFVAPRTPNEELLAGIWQYVLGVERVGVQDSFFDLGGDSIRSLQVQAQARQAGLGLSIEQLFRTPTIAQLAASLDGSPPIEPLLTAPFSLIGTADRERLPAAVEDAYPLATLQAGMLFHSELDTSTSAYHDVFSAHLKFPYIREAFATALQRVQARHPVLRTAFDLTSYSQPLQLVFSAVALPLMEIDLRDESPEQQATTIATWLVAERQRSFDWAAPPLWRLYVHRRADAALQLTLSFHHAILDGWSVAALLTELFTTYFALLDPHSTAVPPALHSAYRDFVAQEQVLRQSAAARDFWTAQLADAPATLLPRWPAPAPVAPHDAVATLDLPCPPAVAQGLRRLARQAGVPLKSVLLAAHLRVLSLLTGQPEVVTGLVTNSRLPEADGAAVLGLFLNTVPFRLPLVGGTWLVLAQQTFAAEQALFPLRGYPLADVQKPQDGPPLFETLFNYINFHVYQALSGRVQLLADDFFEQTNYPLVVNFNAGGTDGAVSLLLRYAPATLSAAQVEAIGAAYTQTLTAMATTPQAGYETAALLPTSMTAHLLHLAQPTPPPLPAPRDLHTWFAQQAAQTPDAVAVVDEATQLSYADLHARANQLAHWLQAQGVGPEVRVGLCVERSVALVVGVLGILAAGGAYVPLDPRAPAERRAWMLADAQAAVLVTEQALQDDARPLPVLCLDRDAALLAAQPVHAPSSAVSPDHLAYVIYTSGSTGTPKGVEVTHANVARLLTVTEPWLQPGPHDVWTLFHSAAFDFSVWELWGALLYGGRLVVVPYLVSRAPEAFYSLLVAEQVTVLNQTPSAFRQLIPLATAQPAAALALRLVIFGGEALDPALLTPWYTHVGDAQPQLVNMYGITETTVHVTYRPLTAADADAARGSRIGPALADLQLYVLDRWGQLAPLGTPGELYVGGAGLARGYLGRPALTAERFVPDPWSGQPGARLYRTGDRARVLPDGDVEYLGRTDTQVKLRGFRIELGEIAAAVAAHAAVREAVVLLRDEQLVAYVVEEPRTKTPERGAGPAGAEVAGVGAVSASELRAFLKARLPEYMVPAAFVTLDRLPLTINGKLDHNALPTPTRHERAVTGSFVAPETPTEIALAEIWSAVLRVEQVGIHDNFFALGGDSILSLQIIARANQAGLRLLPKQLFEHPTIAELAQVVSSAPTIVAEQSPVSGPVLLTPIQQWFFSRELPDPQHYNQAVLLEVQRPLDPERLEQSVTQLYHQHDALRLRFVFEAGSWRQFHAELDDQPVLTRVDLSMLTPAEQLRQLESIAAETQRSLDLSAGPLLRVVLFQMGAAQPDRLLLVVHHLVVDGVSWRVLLEDLETGYRQVERGESIALPAKTTSFQRWALRLSEYGSSTALAAELPYWLTQLQQPTPRVPVDHVGGLNTVESARQVWISLTEEETHALLYEVPSAYQTQINDVLLTALAQSFGQWTDEPVLLLDLEGHGREDLFDDIDLSRTVGWFTSIFPVRLKLEQLDEPGSALKAVKEQLRAIPHHGIGYGLLRYNSPPALTEQLAARPTADLAFNYLGQTDQVMPDDGWFKPGRESSGPTQSPRGTRSHLIDINGMIGDNRLQIVWTYSANLHHQMTIEQLAQSYLEALRALIAHCQAPDSGGYTPSDFPEAELDQEDMDKLFAKLSRTRED